MRRCCLTAGPPGPAGRGDRARWPPTASYTPVVRRLCCLRGISTLTGFGLAVEIGDWHRFTGATIGAYLGLVPTEYSSGRSTLPGLDHQDRQHPRPPAAGRGRLAPPQDLPHPRHDHAGPLGPGTRPPPGPAATKATSRLHQRWQVFTARKKRPVDRQRRHRPRTRRLVLVAGRARVTRHPQILPRSPQPVAARGTTRDLAMNNQTTAMSTGHVRTLDQRTRSSRTARPAVTNPRISA